MFIVRFMCSFYRFATGTFDSTGRGYSFIGSNHGCGRWNNTMNGLEFRSWVAAVSERQLREMREMYEEDVKKVVSRE